MIIGLTGSIASGKSTVAKIIEELGFPVVDADVVARIVVEPNQPALREIAAEFGEDIIRKDGSMDRQKVGEIIFNDAEKRQKLNNIIHPAIRKEMAKQRDKWLSSGFNTVFMDIPLLFESAQGRTVDKILVVSVSPEIQLQRLMARNNLDASQAQARISSQLPLSEKEKGADAVIFNDGTVEETRRQLEKILKEWAVLN
ncbi:dephospho-CoA kinase [Kurthia sibirica]|uniref:Dephospho-CoA kinase n=1 Tax=Kurthia sibirica TaxID=202750 RepID=A0A2U3ANR9_9BACL|nr:dephospho-CoA kinase [Kurthia sibirica]PWI26184.1 dephospho-CoA kinase [Kurthia sibirica]GEK35374.1 dephospho-CoA kinase [Kurthia sibirica]